MGSMRVTQGMMITRSLNDLNRITRRLFALQEELATGQKVNSPSDDPLAARRAVSIQTQIGINEQYLTNISTASPQLTESSSSIQTVISILQRVNELTIEGANGTLSQTQLDQIAVEVDQLLENVLTEANHETNGRYIFAGTRTLSTPFVATRDANGRITAVTYNGNDETIEIQAAGGALVQINESGVRAFQSNQDVFQLLIDIRDNLYSGDQAALQGQRLAELKTGLEQMLASLAKLGAIENRLDRMTINLEDNVTELQDTLSDNVDADYAETVLNLNAQTNAYTAALNATARVIQPSLLDFIG